MPLSQPLTPQKALARLAGLCDRAERCTSELADRLRRWGVGASDSANIIRKLAESRLVDDRRFAAAFALDKMRFSHWGKRKISYALTRKKIPEEYIRRALDGLDNEEYARIIAEAIKSKARTLDNPSTYEGRTKIYRFAISRGYEPELVSPLIRSLFPDRKP